MTNTAWQWLTTENSGLPANRVADVYRDAQDNLWFGTYGGGLARLDPDGTWQTYRAAEGGLINDYVGLVTVDGAGRAWAVCDVPFGEQQDQPGGICVLSPDGTWQVHERGPRENCIVALEADRDDVMWFRIGGFLSSPGHDTVTRCDGNRSEWRKQMAHEWKSFDGAAWTDYEGDRAALLAWYPRRPTGSTGTRLGWVLEGDTVWFLETIDQPRTTIEMPGMPSPLPGMGMFGSFACDYTLTGYDGQRWQQIAIPDDQRYEGLMVDSRGHKWVSLQTLGDLVLSAGVARYDGAGWTVFDKQNGMPTKSVVDISADSRGNVWFSGIAGEIYRWDGAGWTEFPAYNQERGRVPLGRAVEDHQGRLWFRSKAGVVVYTP